MKSMTQTSTNLSGWITSMVLHISVFFALLNTPISKEYTTPRSFLTVDLINEETSLTEQHKGPTLDEMLANASLTKAPNNKLVTHYPIQQSAQENIIFKHLDKKNLANIQEGLRNGNSGKNQVKQVMSVLPKRKPKKPGLGKKPKLEQVNIHSTNTKLMATKSGKISSNNPFDRKNQKEKISVIPSGKKLDKKPNIKPLTNLPTKSNFDEKANLRKPIKISSSTGTDDWVTRDESESPVQQELLLPFKKEPTKLRTVTAQKSAPPNKQHPARPISAGPNIEVSTANNY